MPAPTILPEKHTKEEERLEPLYNVVLLDDDERPLKPLDVVIQRGTNHAWINRGKEPALLAAILIDTEFVGSEER